MTPRPSVEGERRQQIIDAGMACFARNGYHLTTMDDIAEQLPFSKGLLYYYFKTKRDLFLAILDDWMARALAEWGKLLQSDAPAAEQLSACLAYGMQLLTQSAELSRVEFEFYDDKRLTDYRRRRVGFVFQFFNLIPTLTALENVEFALTLTDHDRPLRAIALELLDQVGLKDRADHFPAQLSGGEQQRVAIARALANQPPILLCDEPTGNLDVETGQRVLEVIRAVNQENGSTVVMVTHNAALAPMANRVIRLRSGEIDAVETNPEPR
jgi:ABC-type lipoprotein export system ATPase subunit